MPVVQAEHMLRICLRYLVHAHYDAAKAPGCVITLCHEADGLGMQRAACSVLQCHAYECLPAVLVFSSCVLACSCAGDRLWAVACDV